MGFCLFSRLQQVWDDESIKYQQDSWDLLHSQRSYSESCFCSRYHPLHTSSTASHFELYTLTLVWSFKGLFHLDKKCHLLQIYQYGLKNWNCATIFSSKIGSRVWSMLFFCCRAAWQVCPFFLSFVSVWVRGRGKSGKKQQWFVRSSSSWVPLPSLPLRSEYLSPKATE